MYANLLILGVAATLTSAAVHTVDVSNSNNAFAYYPQSLSAQPGDTVVFNFQNSGHDVAQGTLDSACQPASSGFYSGFQTPPTSFTIDVTDTNPIWFYCSAPGHCRGGMFGVINPASDGDLATYKSKAASQRGTSPSESGGTGGVLGVQGQDAVQQSSTSIIISSSSSSSAVESATPASTFVPSSALAADASSAFVSPTSSAYLAGVASIASTSRAVLPSSSSRSSTVSQGGAVATAVPAAILAVAGFAALL